LSRRPTATQRLSKLHKDVAAELLNKLIGRTGLDVDVKRAADELGMTAREAVSVLRDLQPGEFYAFGPALTRTVTRVKIGKVLSTHPKVGDRLAIKTLPLRKKVRALLQALGDLPREAEAESPDPGRAARRECGPSDGNSPRRTSAGRA